MGRTASWAAASWRWWEFKKPVACSLSRTAVMLSALALRSIDLFQNSTLSCYTCEMTKQQTNPTQPLTPSKYQKLSALKDGPFRRLTGVSRRVFSLMAEILTVADAHKKAKGGRKSKLCIEDRLLMALEYLREYRTYFHIAQNYGISESNAYKICKWVEDTLIKDKRIALPGRKALLESDAECKVILIDASESPIERPKKDKNAIIPAKRSAILSKHSSS